MNVTLPNGQVIENIPEGTTKDQIMKKAISNGLATLEDFKPTTESNKSSFNADMEAGIPSDEVLAVNKALQSKAPEKSFLEKAEPYFDTALQSLAAIPAMAGVVKGGQLLSAGSKAAPYLDDLAKAIIPKTGVGLAAESALGVVSGFAGQKAGEQFDEGLGRDAASTAAGVVVGAVAGTGQTIKDLYKKGFSKSATEAALAASDALGKDKSSALAQTALKANPSLAASIRRASEIKDATGINLPSLAAANGDTTISQFMQSQIAKGENAEFTAAIKLQYEAAENTLKSFKKGVAPSMESVDYYVKKKSEMMLATNKVALNKQVKEAQNREKGLDAITERLAVIGDDFVNVSKEDLGSRTTALLTQREKLIRDNISPRYDSLLKDATEAGLTLKGQDARDLKLFVTAKQNEDVFSKFPRLFALVKSEFSEEPAIASSSIASKYKFARTPPVTKDYPIATLDSLKRAVNSAIRGSDDSDQLRILGELKNQVNRSIDNVDPSFSAAYRELDSEYAKRLGIPYSEAGVVKVNRSKFVEDTVPLLTKNPSAIKQIMTAGGNSPEIIKVVEDAFLMDIANNRGIINTTTGNVNPNQLNRYLKQNESKIDLVPGLKDRLQGISSNANTLLTNRSRIIEAQKQAGIKETEDLWAKSYGASGGMKGLVQRSINTPADLDKLIELTKGNKVAATAVKSTLLDVMLDQQNPAEYLQANKQVFTKFFGDKQANDIIYLSEASSRLKDNPFILRLNITSAQKTDTERMLGSSTEQVIGTLRNQVMSGPRKVLHIASRYFQGRTSASENAAIQEFLKDSSALEQTAAAMRVLDIDGPKSKAAAYFKKLAARQSYRYLAGGVLGFAGGTNATTEPEPYQLDDPSLLEGFGQ